MTNNPATKASTDCRGKSPPVSNALAAASKRINGVEEEAVPWKSSRATRLLEPIPAIPVLVELELAAAPAAFAAAVASPRFGKIRRRELRARPIGPAELLAAAAAAASKCFTYGLSDRKHSRGGKLPCSHAAMPARHIDRQTRMNQCMHWRG
jgi:hypothetical protein